MANIFIHLHDDIIPHTKIYDLEEDLYKIADRYPNDMDLFFEISFSKIKVSTGHKIKREQLAEYESFSDEIAALISPVVFSSKGNTIN